MSVRRNLFDLAGAALAAVLLFSLGSYTARRESRFELAQRDERIAALRAEMDGVSRTVRREHDLRDRAAATAGQTDARDVPALVSAEGRAAVVAEIKRELQSEMGLVPVALLRARRRSFAELYAYDAAGHSNYGTACYVGGGYFITVKHAVVALPEDNREGRKITSVKLVYGGRTVRATLVDAGPADVEVDPGDWAVLRVHERVDLPALHVNLAFSYDFADPIFRLGNDYSKGIILATGYIGQRTRNGLVTCLTDGHPGVSGGGVLNQVGEMVGIPIGRMQGDFRFSFILPLRREMFRKVPGMQFAQPAVAQAAAERVE
jgi:S1-C subfamily serine protease